MSAPNDEELSTILDNVSSSPKRICIIGGGVSGIIAASVLKKEGHDTVIYEKSSRVGGIWKDAYPQASLQNTKYEYRHPDLPYPHDPSDEEPVEFHPTAPQVQTYLERCVNSFQLTVRLNTKVNRLVRNGDELWEVTTTQDCGGNDGQPIVTTETFDFCVIAKGHHSHESIQLPWKGIDKFQGQILTRTQITDLSILRGKRVLVLGFGKTALDMCQFGCEQNAQSVTHCFRKPRHIVPFTLFGIHYTWLIFNRCHNMTIPCWDHAFHIMKLLHTHFKSLFVGLWSIIQMVSWFWHTRFRWFVKSQGIQQRYQLLKPDTHILTDHRIAAALCPPRYFEFVGHGMIEPIQGTVLEVTKDGVQLDDGREVQADIILACVGNLAQTDTFDFLPQQYRDIMEEDPRGVQLYRHVTHPSLAGIGFVGWNQGFLHCPQNYIASLWLSCMLKGEIALPTEKEQLRTIENMKEWKKTHTNFEPAMNCAVSTRHQHYLDVLMQDLGLDPFRKSNPIAEIFARYGASDYTGVVDELQEKRKNSGGTLRLHPIASDM